MVRTNATEDLAHPLSPGFQKTLISRCFVGKITKDYFVTLRLHLRLVRALAQSGCICVVFHLQQLVILFRLVFVRFSTKAYVHVNSKVLQWSKLDGIWNT